MQWTETLNAWSLAWAGWMMASTIETTIVFALIGGIWLVGWSWISPHAAYWLFALVLVKAVLPLNVSVPAQLAGLSPQSAIARLWRGGDLPAVDGATAGAPISATLQDAFSRSKTSPHPMQPATGKTTEEKAAAEADRAGTGVARVALSQPIASLSWTTTAMLCWSAMFVLLSAGLVRGHFQLLRLLQRAKECSPTMLGVDLNDLRTRIGLRRPVRVVSSSLVAAPAVAGLTRPTLILPVGLESRLTAAQLSWVVLHELAHIRRGDLWVAAGQRFVKILFFHHPVVWLASWLVDQQRECACDDEALNSSGCPPHECGAAFLLILDRARSARSALAPALGMSVGQALVKRRLLRLLDSRRMVRSHLSWSAMAGLGLLSCCILPRLGASENQPPIAANEKSGEAPGAPAQPVVRFPPAKTFETMGDAELTKHVTKIWTDQRREIRSAKIRFRQLCLSEWNDKDPLQQGHGLVPRNREEANTLLDRIDLAKDPDRLRELRDELLSGRLIVDQPVYHLMTIAMDGQKLRVDWEDGESVVFDGENCIWLEPAKRQATVYNGLAPLPIMPPTFFRRYLRPGLVLEGLRTIPYSSLTPTAIRRQGHLATIVLGWGDAKSTDEVTVDGEGAVYRITSRTDSVQRVTDRLDINSVSRETFQYGFTQYPGDILFPSVHISTWYPNPDKMQIINISVIEDAHFNLALSRETFEAAVGENTAVWDKRNGLKLRAAEKPVSNVLTLFEK